MLHETMTFLRSLYAGVEEGYLTFTAIHPDKRHAVPSRHVPVGDEAMLGETLSPHYHYRLHSHHPVLRVTE